MVVDRPRPDLIFRLLLFPAYSKLMRADKDSGKSFPALLHTSCTTLTGFSTVQYGRIRKRGAGASSAPGF